MDGTGSFGRGFGGSQIGGIHRPQDDPSWVQSLREQIGTGKPAGNFSSDPRELAKGPERFAQGSFGAFGDMRMDDPERGLRQPMAGPTMPIGNMPGLGNLGQPTRMPAMGATPPGTEPAPDRQLAPSITRPSTRMQSLMGKGKRRSPFGF